MKLAWPVSNTTIGGPNGGLHRLEEGVPWDASDELVKHRPDMFADAPTKVMTSQRGMIGVEQATAAPGERRKKR